MPYHLYSVRCLGRAPGAPIGTHDNQWCNMTDRFNTRVDEETAAVIRAVAELERRSPTTVARHVLQDWAKGRREVVREMEAA